MKSRRPLRCLLHRVNLSAHRLAGRHSLAGRHRRHTSGRTALVARGGRTQLAPSWVVRTRMPRPQANQLIPSGGWPGDGAAASGSRSDKKNLVGAIPLAQVVSLIRHPVRQARPRRSGCVAPASTVSQNLLRLRRPGKLRVPGPPVRPAHVNYSLWTLKWQRPRWANPRPVQEKGIPRPLPLSL